MTFPRAVAALLAVVCGIGGRAAVAGEPRPVRVMAYNVLYDAKDNAASVALVRSVDPDVLCLRELRSPFAELLVKELGPTYPHRALHPKKVGTWGAGIVSRYPVSDVQEYPSTPHKLPVLQATVATPAGKLTVICVHLAPPLMVHRKSDSVSQTLTKNAELRRAQVAALIARVEKRAEAVLVLGDFNEERNANGVRLLVSSGFKDACEAQQSRCGATWPGAASAFPAIWEIDHVLGRGVTFRAARVARGGGSDHYPKVAELELTAAAK